jgi:hypothetical protein
MISFLSSITIKIYTMKRNVIPVTSMILLIVFAVLTSCVSSQSFLPVKGSGMSVDKNYNVSDFHGIDVSGGFDVCWYREFRRPHLTHRKICLNTLP